MASFGALFYWANMKFTKPFRGVIDGEFYPTEFQIGDECPSELLEAAQIMEVVDTKKSKSKEE
jgi:hypothetical protein